MKDHLLKLGWAVIGMIALVLLNLVFFGFVVGFDVAFGAAPQFTVPMFVPLLVIIGGATVMLWKFIIRSSLAGVGNSIGGSSSAQTSNGRRSRTPRMAVLHSTLIIRRQVTPDFSTQGNRAYETSV